jgi:hypothetical protein
MKRFYIVCILDGLITWSNDEKYAVECSLCEDFYVIDTTTNEWLLSDGSKIEILEAGG